jgi:hypothetical protein
MRMNLRDPGRSHRHNCQVGGLQCRESRKRRRSRALRVGARRISLSVMMPGVIVARVMMVGSITQNDCQSSIDRSEHEARRNERAEAKQSKHEGGNPPGCATTSQLARFGCYHTNKMPHRLRGIK